MLQNECISRRKTMNNEWPLVELEASEIELLTWNSKRNACGTWREVWTLTTWMQNRWGKFWKVTPTLRMKKTAIEWYIVEEMGHIMYMLSKFHCELNLVERVWFQAKHYAWAYCKYNIKRLRSTITPALDLVTKENVGKPFRKVRHYMFAYLERRPWWTWFRTIC